MLPSGEPFATGFAAYLDAHPSDPAIHPRVYVPFQPAGVSVRMFGLLDTGGHYCILNEPAAQRVGKALAGSLGEVSLRTARGVVRGELYRHQIRLIADAGRSLELESVVFVPPGWQGPCFLGYTGVLDRIRFAIDPRENRFYFGPLEP